MFSDSFRAFQWKWWFKPFEVQGKVLVYSSELHLYVLKEAYNLNFVFKKKNMKMSLYAVEIMLQFDHFIKFMFLAEVASKLATT